MLQPVDRFVKLGDFLSPALRADVRAFISTHLPRPVAA
jgi:hypothetical protein